MSYLDRKDLLSADLMTRSITKEGSIKYYNTDKNVANIYMKLMAESPDGAQKEVSVDEASNYTVKIDVIKPKTNQIRTVPGVLSTDLTDETCAIWKFELGEDFTNQIGEVICQTYVKNTTQNLTMRYFAYTVEADKLTGLNAEIVTDPDLPILKELIKKVEELQANGGGSNEKVWTLIKDITLTEEVNSIDVTTYSNNELFSLSELIIFMDNIQISVSGNTYVTLNGGGIEFPLMITTSPKSLYATSCIQLSRLVSSILLNDFGAISISPKMVVSSSSIDKITSIKIRCGTLSTTFNIGANIKIYGR